MITGEVEPLSFSRPVGLIHVNGEYESFRLGLFPEDPGMSSENNGVLGPEIHQCRGPLPPRIELPERGGGGTGVGISSGPPHVPEPSQGFMHNPNALSQTPQPRGRLRSGVFLGKLEPCSVGLWSPGEGKSGVNIPNRAGVPFLIPFVSWLHCAERMICLDSLQINARRCAVQVMAFCR
jgi:hypothetical protein